VVAVLPAGAFNAQKKAMAKLREEEREAAEKQALATFKSLVVDFFIFSFLILCMSALIGLGLGCIVSQPLHRLSELMQLVGNLDLAKGSAELEELRSGQRALIRDISELQSAFCRLLNGIEAFSRFVPESVVTKIVQGSRRATRLHVDNKEVTCMFACISDFDSISEKLNEEQILSTLRHYHMVMTEVVERYSGAVAEILDDGLLVYWNTPDVVADHPTQACLAALAQIQALEVLNSKLRNDSLPALTVQIGLHTGNVLSGNIGSDMKMKFGCLGDAVNLSSRINGLCKKFGVSIICSGDTYSFLAHAKVLCRELALVKVKGKQEPTTIFEVVGRDYTCLRRAPSNRLTRASLGVEKTKTGCESTFSQRSAPRVLRFMTDSSPKPREESPDRCPRSLGCSSPSAEVHPPLSSAPSVSWSRSVVTSAVPSEEETVDLESLRVAAASLEDGVKGGSSSDVDNHPAPMRSSTRASIRHALPSAVSMRSLKLPGVERAARALTVMGSMSPWSLPAPGTPTPTSREDCGLLEVTFEQREGVRVYEEALRAYQSADFAEAKRLLEDLTEALPEDKAARRLLERTSMYLDENGAVVGLSQEEFDSWTGVELMTNK